jgi:hypothetical protein
VTMSSATLIRSVPSSADRSDPAEVPTIVSGPPLPRRCGRCRSMFPGDRSLDPTRWWACAPCGIALFGSGVGRRRPSRTAMLPTSGRPTTTNAPTPEVGADDGFRS